MTNEQIENKISDILDGIYVSEFSLGCEMIGFGEAKEKLIELFKKIKEETE